MRSGDPASVVLDTNIIIDLVKLDVLATVCRLPIHSFWVVDEVVGEVTRPEQGEALTRILDSGLASRVSLIEPEELALYARLRSVLGAGEAASIAYAAHRRLSVASNEKRPKFMPELWQSVGEARPIRAADLLEKAIRDGCLDPGSLTLRPRLLRESARSPREIDDITHLDRIIRDVYSEVGDEYAP